MNNIENMIRELCPEGVPHKSLLEIGTLTRGRRFVKDDIRTEGVPCIHYGELYTKYGIWASRAYSFLEAELASNLRKAKTGDVIIVSAGETVEDIGKAVAWLGESEVVVHDACYIFRSELDPRYASHFFATNSFRSQIKRFITSSKVSAVSPQNMGKALIPVPPLKVQQEIVSILDKFTELEAELEAELGAELEARKRQFNYFVDELTSAGTASRLGGVTRPLGDLGEFVRGTGLQKSDLSHEGAPALHYGQIFTYYKTKIHAAKSSVAPKLAASIRQAEHGDVIIATTSENVEDVCKSVVWLGEGDLAVGGETYIFKHELDPLYATYLFRSSDFQYQKLSHISGTKVKRVSGQALEKMTVSVPDREAQVRIGSFLSQLEDLLGDVGQGLPAEIQARRKQYEYYRNKLLTFKELDAA